MGEVEKEVGKGPLLTFAVEESGRWGTMLDQQEKESKTMAVEVLVDIGKREGTGWF